MRSRRSTARLMVFATALVSLSCGRTGDPELTRLEATAKSVTIARDSYGVPHVYGPTDASVVFGLAYARAEDQFPLIERDQLPFADHGLAADKRIVRADRVTEHRRGHRIM